MRDKAFSWGISTEGGGLNFDVLRGFYGNFLYRGGGGGVGLLPQTA